MKKIASITFLTCLLLIIQSLDSCGNDTPKVDYSVIYVKNNISAHTNLTLTNILVVEYKKSTMGAIVSNLTSEDTSTQLAGLTNFVTNNTVFGWDKMTNSVNIAYRKSYSIIREDCNKDFLVRVISGTNATIYKDKYHYAFYKPLKCGYSYILVIDE